MATIMATMYAEAPRELELKLVFAADARPLIDRHPALQPPRATAPEVREQRTTYYDTPDHVLEKNGLSLRVRQDGDTRIQTLKSGSQGPMAGRGEWEWPIETDAPQRTLLADTPAGNLLLREAALEAVTVTEICRVTRKLLLERGTIVEAAIDEGRIRAGDAGEPVHELELELKEGPVGPLYHLALELHADLPLRIGIASKAARGDGLRTGQKPTAMKTSKPMLDRQVGAIEGFRAIALAALGGLLFNQAGAAAADPEGVHQMRAAIRHLRTTQLLFKGHLEPHAAARFETALRRLGRILGEARDWDVFCLETLPAALQGETEEIWRRLLGQAATEQRTLSHRRVRGELARPSLTDLALGWAAWVEGGSLSPGDKAMRQRLRDLAPILLGALARKVRKRGRNLGQHSDTALHALRRSLKKLRYAASYLAPLYPDDAVKPYLKRCRKLEKLLGSNNDATVAVALAEQLSRDDRLDLAPALSVLSQSSEAQRRKIRHSLPKAWRAFREAVPFWE
jgi:triphosphatase